MRVVVSSHLTHNSMKKIWGAKTWFHFLLSYIVNRKCRANILPELLRLRRNKVINPDGYSMETQKQDGNFCSEKERLHFQVEGSLADSVSHVIKEVCSRSVSIYILCVHFSSLLGDYNPTHMHCVYYGVK